MIPTHCRFDDWPALRKRLGLHIIGPGDFWAWPPELMVAKIATNEQTGKEIPMPETEKPKSKLGFVLTQLVHQAELHPGKVQEHKLKSGLTVKVNCEIDGTTRLLLAREGVYPSDTEFATVMAHFPYDPPVDVVPEKLEHKQWFCLRARWATPAKEEA